LNIVLYLNITESPVNCQTLGLSGIPWELFVIMWHLCTRFSFSTVFLYYFLYLSRCSVENPNGRSELPVCNENKFIVRLVLQYYRGPTGSSLATHGAHPQMVVGGVGSSQR